MKNNKTASIIKFILATILAITSLLLLKNLWYQEGVSVSFHYEQEKPIYYQVFFCESNTEVFSEKNSQRRTIDQGSGNANFFFPVKAISRLRIDFGSIPGKVSISKLKVTGVSEHSIGLDAFSCTNIKKCNRHNDRMTIESQHSDPFIVYTAPFYVPGGEISVNWWHLFLILTVPFYLVYVLADMCLSKKKKTTFKAPSLQNLEFLRILFTFGVLIVHFFFFYGIWNRGGQAVTFFFILSGYLLAITYKQDRKILDIALNRYIRFVPLVVLGCILAGSEWRSFQACWMLQNTGLTFGDLDNVPAWYIAVLFWCSLFYTLIFKSFDKRKAVTIISIIGFVTLLLTIHTKGDRLELCAGFITRSMLRGLSGMAIGIVLAQFCRRKSCELTDISRKLVYTVAEIAVLGYIIVGCFDKDIFSPFFSIEVLSHVALLYLFVIKRGYISTFFERPIFSKIATYCLSIYLTHIFFIRTVRLYVIGEFPGWIEQHVVLSIAAAIIGSCIVGVLAHHLVEKPCTRYLTRFFAWMKDGNIRNESKL